MEKKIFEIEIDREILEKMNFPVITAFHKENELNFMLDTGADGSVIARSLLEILENENVGKANLVTLHNSGESDLHRILIAIGNSEERERKSNRFMVTFYLVEDEPDENLFLGKPIHGILGNDFLHDVRAIIDYKNCKLTGHELEKGN
ncbi:MAG: retropepsin-like domain-containing protein [Tannerella sp.]|jgi:hypothetical protein|nr:retropepsin-like domain-containing protein [Tannerella sp.]